MDSDVQQILDKKDLGIKITVKQKELYHLKTGVIAWIIKLRK